MLDQLHANSFPLAGGWLGWGLEGSNFNQSDPLRFHAPSPLVGEGWGEGAQTVSLRYMCGLPSFSPLPSPLPQGARGLDCRNIQQCGIFQPC